MTKVETENQPLDLSTSDKKMLKKRSNDFPLDSAENPPLDLDLSDEGGDALSSALPQNTELLDDRSEILAKIAALEAKIQEKEQIEQDYVNHLQRLSAEFENYKRRSAREATYAVDKGKEVVIVEFLKVLDNFENALKSLKENATLESMQHGLQLIQKQFKDLLFEQGVERIHSIGNEFDPRLHEALFSEKIPNQPANRIVEEYQAGYMLKDKLLRPAKVKVSR